MKETVSNHGSRRPVLFGVLAMALLAIAACGGDESEEVVATSSSDSAAASIVSVSGADFSFNAPDSIAGGLTTLRFTNEGEESHELHVVALNDGVAIHQFQQTLHQEGPDAALEMASEGVHVATVEPGQTAEATVELTAGEYVLICKLTSPDDGGSHAVKGMVKPLTVTVAR